VSATAPILLVGGWTVAARLQPDGYDPSVQTISELAGADASHAWVMALAILSTGVCQLATALALRPAAPAGRLLLAAAGVCTVLVALNPLPAAGEGSIAHAVVATGSFAALAAWPLLSSPTRPTVPWGLRRTVAVTAGCGLLAVTALFFAAVVVGGSRVGSVERVAATLLNLWPFVVAVTASRPRESLTFGNREVDDGSRR
jgi:hypothetical membrane protein